MHILWLVHKNASLTKNQRGVFSSGLHRYVMYGSARLELLRLEHTSETARGLGKTQIAKFLPRHFDSIGLGWGLENCISNKYSDDTGVPGLGANFENLRIGRCAKQYGRKMPFVLEQ